MAKTSTEKSREFYNRQRARGLKRKIIWVDEAGDEVLSEAEFFDRWHEIERLIVEARRDANALLSGIQAGKKVAVDDLGIAERRLYSAAQYLAEANKTMIGNRDLTD
jgi:hypothetical protein